MDLGSFLRKKREEKEMSRWALFRASDVSVSYIKAVEENRSNPHPDILRKLARSLSIEYIKLLQEAGYLTELDFYSETNPLLLEFIHDYNKLPPEKKAVVDATLKAMMKGLKEAE